MKLFVFIISYELEIPNVDVADYGCNLVSFGGLSPHIFGLRPSECALDIIFTVSNFGNHSVERT